MSSGRQFSIRSSNTVFGAEFNSEVEFQTAADTTVGQPTPMGDRGAEAADTLGPGRHGLKPPKMGKPPEG